ncbi:conserved hypothetical protein [Culex quinquefasciatus]|uniref:Translocon-associated protein subunit alpha n=1 Tax=Culex quinquefasciatus TaxID=7176 RepID=B0X0C1_CULQU|nr:conserved hypothetical protein [Culex quinquefasciatus]|eukprot:XP_001863093.1 conserved hypothetical protein [Culex quinquefasciatus]
MFPFQLCVIYVLLVLPSFLLTVDGGSRLKAHVAEDKLDAEVEVEDESLPAGYPAEFLVGFDNKGSDDFIVETIQASFRYRMDFDYFFQNISAIGHPFGMNIAPIYRDASSNQFSEAVFKKIFSIIEGLDGEKFFKYVFLAAIVVLLLVVGQQFRDLYGKRRRLRVDPREDAQEGPKLPQGRKVSPKLSPQQRSGPSETTKS